MDKIVFFDGVCNLCNGAVQQLIDMDKRNVLKFSSLQSETGQKVLQNFNLPTTEFNSILYYKNGKILQKSDAILAILNDIGGGWKFTQIFRILPRAFRDKLYTIVSDNRYKWFGRQESCWIPTKELKQKFLP